MTQAHDEKQKDKSVVAFLRDIPGTIRYLFVGVFVNQLGYFLQGYLVLYMLASHFSTSAASWGLGIFSAGGIIGTMVAASISVRLGDRNTIILSSVVTAIGVAFIPFFVKSETPIPLWSGWIFLCGVLSQMHRTPVSEILGHYLPKEYNVMGFSMFRIVLNVGATLSPVIATYLIEINWSLIFWLSALCSLVYAGIVLVKLPSGKHSSGDSHGHGDSGPGSWFDILSDFRFMAFLGAMAMGSINYIQLFSTLPLAIEAHHIALTTYSTLLSVCALVLIVFELKISAIVRHYPAWIPSSVGTALMGLGVASFGITIGSDWGLALSGAAVIGGLMTCGPTMFAYPSRFPPTVRGRFIGATQAAYFLGSALGPVIGIFIFGQFGNLVWIFCLSLALISSALSLLGMYSNAGSLQLKKQGAV